MEKAAEQAAKDTPAVRAEVSRIGKERHAAEMKKVSLKTSVTVHTRLFSIFDIDKSVLHRQPRELRKLTYSICRPLRKVQKGRRNESS